MEEQFSPAAAQKDVINLPSATNDKTIARLRNTLPRKEILRGFNVFNEVYAKGTPFYASSVSCRVVARKEISNQHVQSDVPVLVGFSVSRKVRIAVERNRVKRLLRETFRAQKHTLIERCSQVHIQLILLFNFNNKTEIPVKKFPFSIVQNEMSELLEKVMHRLENFASVTHTQP